MSQQTEEFRDRVECYSCSTTFYENLAAVLRGPCPSCNKTGQTMIAARMNAPRRRIEGVNVNCGLGKQEKYIDGSWAPNALDIADEWFS